MLEPEAITLPPLIEPTLISNKYVRYSYVAEFDVFDAVSKAIDLILAVPILVLLIVPDVETFIYEFATQCKSTVCRLLIGRVP